MAMSKVRIKVEAWIEMEDDVPISVGDGGRLIKAREITLGDLGRGLSKMLSTKDIKVRHLEALHLVTEFE